MKKLFGIFILFSIAFMAVWYIVDDKKDNVIDDSEERTYKNIVYDMAYSNKKKDGLRANVYTYYLFSKNDNRVLEYVWLTAGNGRHYLYEGTYSGSLDGTILITTNNPNKDSEYKCYFDDYGMYDENENKYSNENVKNVISSINSHFKYT